MPTLPKKRFLAWSYSRLVDWELCPFKAAKVHLEKQRGPSSPQMARGGQVHDVAAEWLTRPKAGSLPEVLMNFSSEFKDLLKLKPECEGEWAFDKLWKPSQWFGDDAWLRVKLDAFALMGKKKDAAIAVDHKTGRHNDDNVAQYKDQLKLYAVAVLSREPKVNTVHNKLWFLDAGKEEVEEFRRKDLATLQDYWAKRATPMLNDSRFAPSPGMHCKAYGGCHLSKAKGGTCKY
jgi:hypothetical protein